MPCCRPKTTECANQSPRDVGRIPFVAAPSASKKHNFKKESREDVVLLPGLGILGDAHCGAHVQHLYDTARHPARPNLRQVHLLEHEFLDELRRLGFDVRPRGTGRKRHHAKSPVARTQGGITLADRNKRDSARDRAAQTVRQNRPLGKGLQAAVTIRGERFAFMKVAVMAAVVAGGKVSLGNAIRVQQPAGTAKFLQPV